MGFRTNRAIGHVEAPPIAEALTWVKGGERNRPLIDLCQALPKYPPAPEVAQEIGRLALEEPTNLYTDIFGLSELRSGLAAHMAADYRGDVEAADVAITPGCNQAFAAAAMVLAGPGDNVILPVPFYFNHDMWLRMLNVEPRYVQAIADGSAVPRPDAVVPLIDRNTRAIALCTPNNPTGAVYPPDVIRRFYEMARDHGIALLIDETYKDFRTDPSAPHNLFADEGWRDTVVQLYSFSKSYALYGYRVGSIIAGPRFLAELEKVLDCLIICAPRISQGAALFSLENAGEWKAGKLKTMRERVSALDAAFTRPDLRYRLVSVGAFFAYLQHPFKGESAKSVAQRLAGEHDLLCLPGSMFGPDQDSYLRLAFANAGSELMPEVVDRLLESQRGAGVA
jgi:aspartate/methionine/tyrosine aminotransferase